MDSIKNYVVIPELPEEEQGPFLNWIIGQGMPTVESEGENKYKCAYLWDYNRWKNSISYSK